MVLITHINDLIVEPHFEIKYFVPAKTYEEFNESAKKIRLKRGMRDYLGYTMGSWRFVYLTLNGRTYVTVRLIHFMDLPDSNLPRFHETILPSLRCHELGHVKINRIVMEKAIRTLRKRLPLDVKEVDRVLTEYWAKTGLFHESYDEKTKHGCGYDRHCHKIPGSVC